MLRTTGGRVLMYLVVCGGALAVLYFQTSPGPGPAMRRHDDSRFLMPSSNRPEPAELSPIEASPFLNTASTVTYVGSDSCRRCHPDEHRSFKGSAHDQSITDVLAETEPPDAEFDDAATGRLYSIYRQGSQLWHRESIRDDAGAERILAEYPMRWAIGSGRFSRSYLIDVDGFLMESPVTWFAARRGWALSPGYEKGNPGFQRGTETRCIRCHAGRVEPIDNSLHRLQLHAVAIDCERCHGPASLHVDRWNLQKKPTTEPDLTIVNPKHLTREQDESICAECHLNSAATVEIRGRHLDGFRPGLSLNDFQINYALDVPNRPMTVDGHVEQMRLSRCHEASETLTCSTCHIVHSQLSAPARDQFYREKCIGCHGQQGCRLDEPERLKQEAQDNCVVCHMPRVPTQLQHFAFTHHRIGIHSSDPPDHSNRGVGVLVPLDDTSHLPKIEQDRCLGLAYNVFSDKVRVPAQSDLYRQRAYEILADVYERDLRDAEVLAALTRLEWLAGDAQRSLEFAGAVLEDESASPNASWTALFTQATAYFDANKFEAALPVLEQLVQMRRFADAWYMLSVCRERTGDLQGARQAAQNAVDINPYLRGLRLRLADLCRRNGEESQAVVQESWAQHLAIPRQEDRSQQPRNP